MQLHKMYFNIRLTSYDGILLLQISLQRLAAQVSGLFVEVEEKNFEKRLGTLLPLVASIISPEQFKMVINY